MPARPEFRPDHLLQVLTERGVDFVVIGGIAAVLWGSPRNTFDLDIAFALDDGNLEALGGVLLELGAKPRGVDDDVPFVPDARTLRRVELLTLNTAAGDLDLLARAPGAPKYESLRRRASRVDIGGFHVLISSIEDLIAMKRAAGRDKDLGDVAELQTIRRLGGGKP